MTTEQMLHNLQIMAKNTTPQPNKLLLKTKKKY